MDRNEEIRRKLAALKAKYNWAPGMGPDQMGEEELAWTLANEDIKGKRFKNIRSQAGFNPADWIDDVKVQR